MDLSCNTLCFQDELLCFKRLKHLKELKELNLEKNSIEKPNLKQILEIQFEREAVEEIYLRVCEEMIALKESVFEWKGERENKLKKINELKGKIDNIIDMTRMI